MKSISLAETVRALSLRVVAENIAAGRRIALAESCTGGMVSAAITDIAGSSHMLDCSFVTYSNDAKTALLGVPADLIDAFGAVSVAVAWSMAQGALLRSSADVAVAITGIAGPEGGSEQKPVGTVVFAVAHRGDNPEDIQAEMKLFAEAEDRAEVRLQATICALELLLP